MDRSPPTQLMDELLSALPELLAYAMAFTGDRGSAQDLVQEAVTRLLTSRREPSPVAPYLKTTMRNLRIDAARAADRRGRRSSLIPQPTERDIGDDVATRVDLRAALERLPIGPRTLLVLRYLDDLSTEDIAGRLVRPSGTVRRQLYEALHLLREAGYQTSLPPYPRKGPDGSDSTRSTAP